MTQSVYFHFTGEELDVRTRLTPQDDGFTQWPEARALETILERYRPADKLPRSQSVFLFKGPVVPDQSFGAASSAYCCVVDTPNNPEAERSDIRWFRDLDHGFEDVAILEEDFTEAELRERAEGYWSGKPCPGQIPMFEYRAPYADVKLCRDTAFFVRKADQKEEAEHTL